MLPLQLLLRSNSSPVNLELLRPQHKPQASSHLSSSPRPLWAAGHAGSAFGLKVKEALGAGLYACHHISLSARSTCGVTHPEPPWRSPLVHAQARSGLARAASGLSAKREALVNRISVVEPDPLEARQSCQQSWGANLSLMGIACVKLSRLRGALAPPFLPALAHLVACCWRATAQKLASRWA